MADYWKSQAKKYCDFCKCWIADNKPSVEFHEKGKRHRENVEKRLKEIGQRSRKEHKESLKLDDEMRKMEEAATRAYLKDVEGGGGDYTSRLLQRELEDKDERAREEKRRQQETAEPERTAKKESDESSLVAGGSGVEVPKGEGPPPWLEATSDEGHTYYWHAETGEAAWEAPGAGFVTIAEQAAREGEESRSEERRKRAEERARAAKKGEEDKERGEEERARKAREKMKARAAKKEARETAPFEPVEMGPVTKPDPYGGWKAVERCGDEPVDLELPTQNYAEVYVPAIVDAAPGFRIREKTIGCLDGEGSGDFKKRKFNGSSRKNARQRLDEQD